MTGHGGKRAGAGRPAGILKNKLMFGYKYTEDEYKEMSAALEKFKTENGCTTSRALYLLVTQKKNQDN